MLGRQPGIAILTLACLTLPAHAGERGAHAQLVRRIDDSLEKAGRLLVERQANDGAWRSRTYGAFRDGPSLTPYVLSALGFVPQAGPSGEGAFRRGVEYLLGPVGDDGQLKIGPRELLFPVYTSAMASRVVLLGERGPRNLRAQQAWLAYLRGRQLNEALSWEPADLEYGGWGFSLDVPRKPAAGRLKDLFVESNLSATLFALGALKSARVPRNDPAYAQALVFVRRCQNFSDDTARADPQFDDGGFFFIPGDPNQNKAGAAGEDRFGRPRFHSYGTMTADGLRALLCCGLPKDHGRVRAARKWLERNFSAAANPGNFAPDRAVLQNATYYYWTWAAAHAFLAVDASEIETRTGSVRWADVLAEELLRRQEGDGSWVNPFTDAKEDDPLVATPWAAAALAICRGAITGVWGSPPGPAPSDSGARGRFSPPRANSPGGSSDCVAP